MRDLTTTFAAIDAANADDPNRFGDEPLARAQGQAASRWLAELEAHAQPALQLAVRAHHLKRWELKRGDFPEGRQGYLQWRRENKAHQADSLQLLMEADGWPAEVIERARLLLGRTKLHTDAETQALEDAACLVFLETQFDDMATRTEHDHLVSIVAKTLKKMSPKAVTLASSISLSTTSQAVLSEAVASLQPEAFMTTERELREATLLVRGGLERSAFDETAEGLFLTSGYVYSSAAEAESAFAGDHDRYIYSRYGNPTVSMFEERLRLIEGAEACMATASGMAAVFASLAAVVNAGDKVVGSRALFGSCHVILSEILPRLGADTVLVDGTSLTAWEEALAGGAKAVFLETPSNPGLEIIDLTAVCELAHAAGAIVIVDNVFASPVLQKPLEMGADIVVYSATKHIDGQGRVLGGAVLSSEQFKTDFLMPFTRHTGPSLSPFNAWVLLKGLETLRLRVDAMARSAQTIAEQLEAHAAISHVGYPMLASHPQFDLAKRQMSAGGTVLTIDVDTKDSAFALMDALQLFDISNNVGDSKSLATHPATTTHRRIGAEGRALVGIGDGMIRLSIGLEDPADLLTDLTCALSKIR